MARAAQPARPAPKPAGAEDEGEEDWHKYL